MTPFNERNCVRVFKLIFFTADTITVRLLLAGASFFYAVLLVWPASAGEPALFDRPAYALMALVPGGEWTWATAFLLHWAGVHWRAIDPVERVPWGLAVNILGLVIWSYSTAALNISLGRILPGTALEWTMVAASAWALYRTGLRREVVSD
ncbi:hypothetical protein WIX39_018680 [Variovorax sp. AB1(2024)]|uniref:hypothetical protein n=1 Tax=Variovorax sp. AB1(2024) TaxID=3132214 RepID=UPI0030984F38